MGADVQTQRTEIRLDKWLVYARFCKTRSQAAGLVEAGKVRVNGRKIEKPDAKLHLQDVLTLAFGSQIKLVEVLQLATSRGSPEAALAMYEILPQEPPSLE